MVEDVADATVVLKMMNALLIPNSADSFETELGHSVRYTSFNVDTDLVFNPDVTRSRGKKYWTVKKAFKFYHRAGDRTQWVVVPEGFHSDGATVPVPLLNKIIKPWGNYTQAVLVHDVLCVHHQVYSSGQLITISQKKADDIFLEAMEVSGVSWLKRHAMYVAVRIYQTLFR